MSEKLSENLISTTVSYEKKMRVHLNGFLNSTPKVRKRNVTLC